jgi:hypothetical protein
LSADSGKKGGKGKNKDKRQIECFHCHKMGHVKADCWAKGGGNEGGGPQRRKKEDAAQAEEEGRASGLGRRRGDGRAHRHRNVQCGCCSSGAYPRAGDTTDSRSDLRALRLRSYAPYVPTASSPIGKSLRLRLQQRTREIFTQLDWGILK